MNKENYESFKYKIIVKTSKYSGIQKDYLNERFASCFYAELCKINKILQLGLDISIIKLPLTKKDLKLLNKLEGGK